MPVWSQHQPACKPHQVTRNIHAPTTHRPWHSSTGKVIRERRTHVLRPRFHVLICRKEGQRFLALTVVPKPFRGPTAASISSSISVGSWQPSLCGLNLLWPLNEVSPIILEWPSGRYARHPAPQQGLPTGEAEWYKILTVSTTQQCVQGGK
jgi:hypothetical protein